MTLAERQLHLQLFFSGCLAITASKGKDYNPDAVVMLDVLESAVDKNDTIPGVLWIYYRKHFTAIKSHFLRGHTLASEPITGRLQDAANYFGLLSFYDTHKHKLHAAWRQYWMGQPCELALHEVTGSLTHQSNQCQRCETLSWLERAAFGIGSDPDSSRSTPKEPD